MSELFQDYNLKLIKWLNKSYDQKGLSSDLAWSLRPPVFVKLSLRFFFIIFKVFIKITKKIADFFIRKSPEQNSSQPTPVSFSTNSPDLIQTEDIFNLPFLNILLYRKVVLVRNREHYNPSNLPSLQMMQESDLFFTPATKPVVSIIIPVYNKIEYTFNCLLTLKNNIEDQSSFEIILVNDRSSDATKEILSKVKGLVLINNEENLGFIQSCNKGASLSKGDYLCFLNNDTEIQKNWLESMLQIFRQYPNAGLVGSMLIYPENILQEAGGVIWKDATGLNYGRMQDTLNPKYNFVRPVDYCSGASITLSKKDFEQLGGFEKEFIPAYYEDTDLCFAVRHKLGKQVIFQPASRLIHHEGITSGTSTSSGVKRYQDINHLKFKDKWAKELELQLESKPGNWMKAAVRYCGDKTILIVDTYVPLYDKESGSYRMFHLIKILKQLGYHVIFAPYNGVPEEPYTHELQQLGVEVLYYTADFKTKIMQQVEERLSLIDVAWVCRPEITATFLPVLRKNPHIKIIYDTIDLHYIRLQREAELHPERKEMINWPKMKQVEQQNGKAADLTIAITDTDNQTLQSMGIENVETIPNIHVPYAEKIPGFEERKGILFIGGFNHRPNVDAVLWLCNEIMPIVWKQHPDLKVTLLGSSPTDEVKALEGSNVKVPGFISDVTDHFLHNRIFVAPLTYGAGMKGKIGQSMEFALPVVSTNIGVEGMHLKPSYNCLVADTTNAFAEEILRLYFDKNLWQAISSNCHEAIYPFSPAYVKEKLSEILKIQPVEKI